MTEKHKCPICGKEFIHYKRLIGHMTRGNCGKLAGQMGIKLELNGRTTKGLKQFEKKEEESETEETDVVERVVPENVVEDIPEPEPEGDKPPDEPLPEGVELRDGKHYIQCPGGCNYWLCIEEEPKVCPSCNMELIWN